MSRRAEYHVARAGDGYIVERYLRGYRETEGPFTTRAQAQAWADELNARGASEGEGE